MGHKKHFEMKEYTPSVSYTVKVNSVTGHFCFSYTCVNIDVYAYTHRMQWDMILNIFLNVDHNKKRKTLKAVVLDSPSSL